MCVFIFTDRVGKIAVFAKYSPVKMEGIVDIYFRNAHEQQVKL